ncbi:hypothetical protein OAK17_03020 [Alphaproteobacteria bacterium]|nr:hypothetical protein [Alphaproteobacteria bacterium]
MRIERPDAIFYPSHYNINAELRKSVLSCFRMVAPESDQTSINDTLKLIDLSSNILTMSSAAYHNLEHTALVTMCGLDLIEAISLKIGKINTEDLCAYIASLLFHDIGYVKGVCNQDHENTQVISSNGKTINIPDHSTDAFLTPYHVERGKIFAAERLSDINTLDLEKVKRFISETTFPVPQNNSNEKGSLYDFAACVQSADLIGQMGDPGYINKLSKLYLEFKETGAADKMNINNPSDLKVTYPQFFWSSVYEHIKDHVEILENSPRGKKWITALYKNVFTRQKSATFSLSAQILFDRMLKVLSTSESNFEILYGLAKGFLEFYDGWAAHVYEVDPLDGVLKTKRIWYVPNENKDTQKFVKESEKFSFVPGHGMPGRCLVEKEPQWNEDFSSLDVKDFPRAKIAKAVGVKAALSIPILSKNTVTSVIEIFSLEPKSPTTEDLAFMRLVTDYVGAQFNL